MCLKTKVLHLDKSQWFYRWFSVNPAFSLEIVWSPKNHGEPYLREGLKKVEISTRGGESAWVIFHLGAPQASPKLEKPCHGQNFTCGGWHFVCSGRHFACSGRHFACGGRHFACCGWQGSWGSKKLLAQEFFFTFLKIFLSFLGFSRVKIHFFQKVLKKWSSFRKKLLYFFHF